MRLSARFPLLLGATFLVACGEPAPDAAPVGDALPPQPLADAPAPPPRLGLWVLCEGSQRVLEHPDRVPLLVDQALALGATDLFVQVYRGGRAWFRSSYADPLPYEIALVASDADPLARLIGLAHAAGLRVHAWVNVLSLASNRDAPMLHALGPGAVSVDRRGRSILEFPKFELPPPDSAYLRMGTPALWLDPAAPGVTDWLASTFSELVENYPSLDGIHFDYIRYPDVLPFTPGSRFRVGLDFGYGAASRARFERETGLRAPSRDSSRNGDAWDQWRRERVADILREVRARTFRAKPDLLFSAAVSAYPERAYLSLYQDWRGWLDEELLDFAVAMLYTRDDRLLRYEANAYTGGIGGERLWIGLGSWLFANAPERAVAQLRLARDANAIGQALFSYDAIAEAPALRDALVHEANLVR